VLVSRVHYGVVEAVQYARSLRPDHLVALHVAVTPETHAEIRRDWERLGLRIPLDIVDSPYRELVQPVERYIDALDARWADDRITVVIPEFVMGVRRVANVLHGQQGLALKLALLDRPNTAVLSIPFHVHTTGAKPARAPVEPAPSSTPSSSRPRLSAGLDELERSRLLRRFAERGDGSTSISEMPERVRVRLVGEVTASRVVSNAPGSWLQLTVSDGTGSVQVVFTGRREIRGLEPGRGVVIEGVGRRDRGATVILNPRYTLLA
jgi:hypothetical protein